MTVLGTPTRSTTMSPSQDLVVCKFEYIPGDQVVIGDSLGEHAVTPFPFYPAANMISLPYRDVSWLYFSGTVITGLPFVSWGKSYRVFSAGIKYINTMPPIFGEPNAGYTTLVFACASADGTSVRNDIPCYFELVGSKSPLPPVRVAGPFPT